MRTALLCVLLGVGLLSPSLAVAQGEDGLTLRTSSVQTFSPSPDLVVAASYRLTYASPQPVSLSSGVRLDGINRQHEADWAIDGADAGTSSHLGPAKTGAPGEDSIIDILWSLGDATSGTYVLNALVIEQCEAGGGQACNSQPIGQVAFEVRIQPTVGGGGGGPGAGDDGIAAVTGLRLGDVRSDAILMVWNVAAGATAYRIHRSTTSGFEPGAANVVGTTTSPSFTDTQVSAGTLYHYRVRGFDASGREGALSAQLSVRATQGPDVTPPDQVGRPLVVKTTANTTTLAWEAAFDDVGPLSYEIHRGQGAFTASSATAVGTTTGLTFTDTGLSPATAYTYRIRAVDRAGNLAPPSEPVDARTLEPAQDDGRPPAVLGLTFTGSGEGWTLAGSTDEPAVVTVRLEGVGAARTLADTRDVGFAIGLGSLDDGLYAFTVTATDDVGDTGTRSGSFRVGSGFGRYVALAPTRLQELQSLLGATGTDVYLVDADLDGRTDRIESARGEVEQRRAMPGEGQFLLEADGLLVLVTATGALERVVEVPGSVEDEASSDAVRTATVRVDGKDGWILVTLDDPNPGLPLLGVERADGTPLPPEAAWREGATLAFLDDPAATYRVLYDNAGRPGQDGGDGGVDVPDWALWLAAGFGGVLLGMALMLVALRRRPRA